MPLGELFHAEAAPAGPSSLRPWGRTRRLLRITVQAICRRAKVGPGRLEGGDLVVGFDNWHARTVRGVVVLCTAFVNLPEYPKVFSRA